MSIGKGGGTTYQTQQLTPEQQAQIAAQTNFFTGTIAPAYQQHIEWLDPQDSLRRATNGFKSMLSFIENNDGSRHWPRFVKEVADLDRVRDENFWTTFPEFAGLI